MIVSMLNSHPNVLCHGEAFHRERIYARSPLNVVPLVERNSAPVRFAEQLFKAGDERRDCLAVGFKLFYHHNIRLLRYVIKDCNIRIILLRRDDKLSQYASRKIALKTNEWHQKKNINKYQKEHKNKYYKIRYSIIGHALQIISSEVWYKVVYFLLNINKKEYLEINYEQFLINMNAETKQLQMFLDLPEQQLSEETVRQNPPDAVARFRNPEAAKVGQALQNRLMYFMRRIS